MKVALIIGHNKRREGAYSTIVGSEYDYWENVAKEIKDKIPELVDVYERKPNLSYIPEMNEVLKELNSKDYKFCLELHYNAVEDKQAHGCECLVYHKNEEAKKLARNFLERLNAKFGSKIRGLIEVQDSKIRGGYGICNSKDTYILVEPFFGSNDDEALKFSIVSDVVDLFVEFIKDNL